MLSQVSQAQCAQFSIDFVNFGFGNVELIHHFLLLHCVMSQEWLQLLSFIIW